MLELIKAGIPLVPLKYGNMGNAVYVKKDRGSHVIVTDFGTEIILSDEEIIGLYKIPDWWFSDYTQFLNENSDYFSLKQRWSSQIEMLQEQLSILEE